MIKNPIKYREIQKCDKNTTFNKKNSKLSQNQCKIHHSADRNSMFIINYKNNE